MHFLCKDFRAAALKHQKTMKLNANEVPNNFPLPPEGNKDAERLVGPGAGACPRVWGARSSVFVRAAVNEE